MTFSVHLNTAMLRLEISKFLSVCKLSSYHYLGTMCIKFKNLDKILAEIGDSGWMKKNSIFNNMFL